MGFSIRSFGHSCFLRHSDFVLRHCRARRRRSRFVADGRRVRRGRLQETKPIEAAPVNLGRPVDFEKDVYPILEANCVACHNAGIAESKLSVETAETIRKGGKRGPAVTPKNPATSLLFQFASRARRPAMPPLPNTVEANALSPKELGTLKQWILEGAAGGAAGRARHDSVAAHPGRHEIDRERRAFALGAVRRRRTCERDCRLRRGSRAGGRASRRSAVVGHPV